MNYQANEADNDLVDCRYTEAVRDALLAVINDSSETLQDALDAITGEVDDATTGAVDGWWDVGVKFEGLFLVVQALRRQGRLTQMLVTETEIVMLMTISPDGTALIGSVNGPPA